MRGAMDILKNFQGRRGGGAAVGDVPPVPPADELQSWRERILSFVLAVTAGLSLVALAPAVYMGIREETWWLLGMDLAAFGAVAAMLAWRGAALGPRTAVALSLPYLLGVVVICELGFVSGGIGWLFCFGVMAGVLAGLRPGLAAVALNAVTMIVLGWAARKGLLGGPPAPIPVDRAAAAAANFVFLNALCTVSAAALVQGLQRSNRQTLEAAEKLRAEHGKLALARLQLQQEIDERRASERAAQDSERRYRLLAESIRDVIWTMDLDLRFTYVSPAVTRMLGWPVDEYMALSLEQIMAPGTCAMVRDRLARELARDRQTRDEQRSVTLELELNTRDGGRLWAEVTAGFLRKPDGQPSGILGVTRDITERRRAQQEKLALMERLSRARKMEAIGTLAGGVAHDLNNVLAGIVSYPDLLLLELPADSPLRGPVKTMRDSGRKAAAIVQDLLTLARRGVAVSEPVEINALVEEYLGSPEFARLHGFHPQVAVECELAEGLPAVMGSPVHLSKALMNLVSNAAEAMPEGGRLRIVTARRRLEAPHRGFCEIPAGDYVLLQVADSGVGMSAEDMGRIFEPFYTKKKMGRSGTGLGMAVVWGTVQDHKGHIDLESAAGRGTVVSVYLPAGERPADAPAAPPPLAAFRGAGETVLVVDDMREQREVTAKILAELGYRAEPVDGGEAAVARLKQRPVDLVMLDMIMDPGIDGLETYRRIRSHRPEQRVLIVSGFAEDERVKEAQRLGAGAYLAKPFTVEQLARAVKAELEGRSSAGGPV